MLRNGVAMQSKLVYVELKSEQNDRGPAWIGKATRSRTAATVYFNGKAFRRIKGSGISGNYFETESGDEYWISGVKKNGEDRHWAGGGNIEIDRGVVDEYLALRMLTELPRNFLVVDLQESNPRPEHDALEHESPYEDLDDWELDDPLDE